MVSPAHQALPDYSWSERRNLDAGKKMGDDMVCFGTG